MPEKGIGLRGEKMNKRIRSFLVFTIVVLAMLVITGCSNTEEKITKEYAGVLYFANEEYVETGNEEIDRMIRMDDFNFQCEEGRQYFYLINVALRTVPEELTGADTCIDDKIVVNDVIVEDGIATVDLASGKMNGGSLTEAFVISQIVESLFASFEEVNRVQFLVDGKKAESLMGHFDVRGPFTREMYN